MAQGFRIERGSRGFYVYETGHKMAGPFTDEASAMRHVDNRRDAKPCIAITHKDTNCTRPGALANGLCVWHAARGYSPAR